MSDVTILTGDVRQRLRELPDESVHCCVTSPPYFGLRDYGVAGQIGIEDTIDAYVDTLVAVFDDVRRVLRPDGTLWLNLGDSYAGSWGAQGRRATDSDNPSWHSSQIKNHPKRASHTGALRAAGVKPKDLYGAPWRVAFALQAAGWWLRSDIIWHKPNPMPESITDRPTSAHEHIFLLAKSEQYFYDHEAIKEPAVAREPGEFDGGPQRSADGSKANNGRNFRKQDAGHRRRRFPEIPIVEPAVALLRNRRNVWVVTTKPFKGAHFATFPPDLIEPCIKAGCPEGGLVLDPFGGAGTTGIVAQRLARRAVLIELNPEYATMAKARIDKDAERLIKELMAA